MSKKLSYKELEKKVLKLEKIEKEFNSVKIRLEDEINFRRILTDESRDPIVVVGEGGIVFEANQRFADMLGYSLKEVYKLKVWDWEVLASKEQILELFTSIDNEGHHFETKHRRKDGEIIDVELSNNGTFYRGKKLAFCICRDITAKKRAQIERENLISKLQLSLSEIKTLREIIPLCMYCKKVRDDEGYWERVDIYIKKHFDTNISHGICPECMKKYFPGEI